MPTETEQAADPILRASAITQMCEAQSEALERFEGLVYNEEVVAAAITVAYTTLKMAGEQGLDLNVFRQAVEAMYALLPDVTDAPIILH